MIAELWNIHAKEKTTYTPRERQLQVSKIKYKTVFFFMTVKAGQHYGQAA